MIRTYYYIEVTKKDTNDIFYSDAIIRHSKDPILNNSGTKPYIILNSLLEKHKDLFKLQFFIKEISGKDIDVFCWMYDDKAHNKDEFNFSIKKKVYSYSYPNKYKEIVKSLYEDFIKAKQNDWIKIKDIDFISEKSNSLYKKI